MQILPPSQEPETQQEGVGVEALPGPPQHQVQQSHQVVRSHDDISVSPECAVNYEAHQSLESVQRGTFDDDHHRTDDDHHQSTDQYDDKIDDKSRSHYYK